VRRQLAPRDDANPSDATANIVNMNDIERNNRRYVCVILPNSAALGDSYVKVVEVIPILSARK